MSQSVLSSDQKYSQATLLPRGRFSRPDGSMTIYILQQLEPLVHEDFVSNVQSYRGLISRRVFRGSYARKDKFLVCLFGTY